MKFARPLCAALLVLAATAACGGEEAPAEASTQDRYCEAYRAFFAERAEQDMETTDAEVVATLKEWGQQLDEIGAPDDMPEAAKGGHGIWSDLIAEVEDDANQADVVALESGLTQKQMSQVEEFFAYNDSTCLGSGRAGSPEAPPEAE